MAILSAMQWEPPVRGCIKISWKTLAWLPKEVCCCLAKLSDAVNNCNEDATSLVQMFFLSFCCRQGVTQTDVCLMKRLHSTEHLNKEFAIKSSQAYNTNLIKADKWNHLNVLTSVLPDAALIACMLPVAITKDSVQHVHPIERRWQITFKKMLDSSNFFWCGSEELLVYSWEGMSRSTGPARSQQLWEHGQKLSNVGTALWCKMHWSAMWVWYGLIFKSIVPIDFLAFWENKH